MIIDLDGVFPFTVVRLFVDMTFVPSKNIPHEKILLHDMNNARIQQRLIDTRKWDTRTILVIIINGYNNNH